MAKKPAAEQEGEISISMVKFTMKGSDASLQKGLDTIKAAFAQAGFAISSDARPLRRPANSQLPLVNGEDIELEVDEIDDAPELEDTAPATPAPRRPSTPRKPPNFKIIKELKFDDVVPTLSDFVDEKKPENHLDRYLCIAYWFKHHKDLEDLTTQHFFTAYMHYRWPLPASADTPVRDLRHRKRQHFLAGDTQGTTTISNSGERIVLEMGKAAS
ncbi:hypothetical protein A7P25_02030 [Achromobacter xylosoxidans]|nr:hypothetical protein A7P25_02030 [Achromobacter xylosoxidans]